MSFRYLQRWICLTLFLGFIVGCGDSNLSRVRGKVTLDDEPLEDALVMFTPIEGGRPAAARTDANGKYELVYDRKNTGAMLGEYVVEITTGDELEMEDGTSKVIPERVPKKYNFDTELRETVESGDNEIDFPLKSGGEVIQSEGADG